MRLSKQQAAENRRHILETALQLFRRHGFDRVGIAELMRAAGFTHGGFYNHFSSKEALAAEACASAFASSDVAFAETLRKSRGGFRRYLARELSLEVALEPGPSCTLAALAGDAARQGTDIQSQFARSIEAVTGTLSEYFARAHPAPRRIRTRARALNAISTLVGAWVLARAVSRSSPDLAREILLANRQHLSADDR